MANTVNLNINADDNGSIDRLRKKTQDLANDAKAYKKNLTAAAKSGGGASDEGRLYDNARAGGGTGAAGRDFANQARGLDGLVRVYAVFAANIFAATAALGALSKAMDTENMVKGLDQLGAATGKNLGQLSKRVVEATNGAVSLREAMEATVKASSSGIKSDDILRLSTVAAKASQTLGVDMGDALSRLTRGITKLEPELLDELGLFTKLDQATQDYARSIGKSASSLSDFERRQAFANAVLKEGEDKFGSIKVDANPYTQLLATFKNVAQSGLELINKVLGPVVKLLSESPTALAVGIAGIAGLLLKQAIPAIGQWRAGLEAAAKTAYDTSKKLADSFNDTYQNKLESIFKVPDLQKQLKLAEFNVKQAQKTLQSVGGSTIQGPLKPTGFKSVDDAKTSEAQIKSVNNLLDSRIEKQKALLDGSLKLSKSEQEKLANEVKSLSAVKSVTAASEAKLNLDKAINAQAAIKLKLDEAREKIGDVADKKIGRLDPETLNLNKALEARQKYERLSAVAAAAETTRTVGMRLAWKELGDTIQTNGTKGFEKFRTQAQGAVSIVTSRVMGLLGAFSTIGMVVGAAVVAFELLSFMFSKNSKEAAAAASAYQGVTSGITALNNTLELINSKKDALNFISAASVLARATALDELSTSMETLTKSTLKAAQAQSWFDELTNFISGAWGGSLEQKLNKGLSDSIASAIMGLPTSKLRESFVSEVTKITGLSEDQILANPELLAKAFSKLGETGKIALSNLSIELKNINSELLKGANNSKAFSDSISEASKKFDELVISASTVTSFSKLAAIAAGTSVQLDNSVNLITDLNKVAGETKLLALLPPGLQQEIMAVRGELAKLAEDQKNSDLTALNISKRVKAEQALAEAKNKLPLEVDAGGNTFTAELDKSFQLAVDKAKELEKISKESTERVQTAQAKLKILASETSTAFFKSSIKQIETSLEMASASASRTIKSAMLSSLPSDTTGVAQERIKAEMAQIDASSKLTRVMLDLIVSNERLRVANEIAANTIAASGPNSDAVSRKTASTANAKLREESDFLELLSSGKTLQALDKLSQAPVELRQKFQQLTNTVLGLQTTLIELGGKQAALKYEKEITALQEVTKLETNRLGTLSQRNALQQLSISLEKSNTDIVKDSTIDEKERLDSQLIMLDARRREAQILEDIYKTAKNPLLSPENKRENIDRLHSELDLLEKTKELQLGITKSLAVREKIQREAKFSLDRLEILRKEYNIIDLSVNTQKELRDIELDRLQKVGSLTESELKNKQYLIELTNIEADKNKQIRDVAVAYAQEQIKLKEAQDKQGYLGDNGEVERIKAEQLASQSLYQTQVAGILAVSDSRTKALTSVKLYNDQMKVLADITTSLSTIFGTFGENLGKFGQSLIENTKLLTALDNKEAEIQARKKNSVDDNDIVQANRELNDIQSQRLGLIGKEITAGKNLFGQKTAAYKGIMLLEKAVAVQKLILDAQSIASTIATIPAQIAGGVSKLFAQGGFAGFPAAAAFIAIMASLGHRGSASIPSGFKAEEQQKVQGTGQDYINGALQDNGGGVLGDSSAKSEDVKKSLELLQKYQFTELEYSNQMVLALKAIEINTKGLAGQLSRISGLQSGSAFGTTNGSSGGAVFGLFTKKSTEILDAGIKIFGKLTDLVSGGGSAQQYENVKSSSSSFFGLFKSSSTNVNSKDLDAAAGQAVRGLFKATEVALVEAVKLFDSSVGGKLGALQSSLEEELKNANVNIQVSTYGLSGTEIAAAIEAEVGIAMNGIITGVIPFLSKFQEVGEGLLTTLTRLATDISTVNNSFELAGVNFKTQIESLGKSAEDTISVYEDLVNKSGGLEAFASKSKKFTDNFLTEAQRLEPIQARVVQAMANLGQSSVDTREEFAALVRSIDFTKAGSIDLYVSLMGISEAFAMVYKETEPLKDVTLDLAKQNVTILKLQGKAQESINLQRQLELDSLDSRLRAGQTLIWQLEDEAALLEKEKALREQTNKLNIELLNAQGKAEEALRLTREEELDALPEILRNTKKLVYAYTDLAQASASLDTATAKYKSSIEALRNYQEGLNNTIQDLNNSISDLQSQMQDLYNTTQSALESAKSEFIDLVHTINDGIVQIAKDAEDALQDAAKNALSAFDDVSSKFADAKSSAKDMLDTLRAGVVDATDAFKQGFSDLVGNIASLYEEANSKLSELLASGNTQLDKLKADREKIETDFLNYYKGLVDQKTKIEQDAAAKVIALGKQLSDAYAKAIEDEASIKDKIAKELFDAQKAYNDAIGETTDNNLDAAQAAYDAAKATKKFSDDLYEFINQLRGTELGGQSGPNQLAFTRALFEDTLAKATAGDETARSNLTSIASNLIELSKSSAKTFQESQKDILNVQSKLSILANATNVTVPNEPSKAATTKDITEVTERLRKAQEAASEAGVTAKDDRKSLLEELRAVRADIIKYSAAGITPSSGSTIESVLAEIAANTAIAGSATTQKDAATAYAELTALIESANTSPLFATMKSPVAFDIISAAGEFGVLSGNIDALDAVITRFNTSSTNAATSAAILDAALTAVKADIDRLKPLVTTAGGYSGSAVDDAIGAYATAISIANTNHIDLNSSVLNATGIINKFGTDITTANTAVSNFITSITATLSGIPGALDDIITESTASSNVSDVIINLTTAANNYKDAVTLVDWVALKNSINDLSSVPLTALVTEFRTAQTNLANINTALGGFQDINSSRKPPAETIKELLSAFDTAIASAGRLDIVIGPLADIDLTKLPEVTRLVLDAQTGLTELINSGLGNVGEDSISDKFRALKDQSQGFKDKLEEATSKLEAFNTATTNINLGSNDDTLTGLITSFASASTEVSSFAEIVKQLNSDLNAQRFGESTVRDYINSSVAAAAGDAGQIVTNLTGVYNRAIVEGINSNTIDRIMGWAPGSSNAWALAHNLPAFAEGTNYVSRDTLAMVHQGEAIVPAQENQSWSDVNAEMVTQINTLSAEIKRMREENNAGLQAIASYTNNTNKILVRVTPDGDAIATRVAT